jgi:hypothetical protein
MSLQIAKLYNSFIKYPFGKQLFSFVFSWQAPYFLNLRANVHELKPGLGHNVIINN